MSLSARHYLEVYQFRLDWAEQKGAPTNFIADMRQLVSALAALDPATIILLEHQAGKTLFKNEATGELIAEGVQREPL